MKRLNLYILLAVTLLLGSCLRNKDKYKLSDINSTTWEPTIAIPLMNSDLTVYNVLQKIDDNNVVVIDSSSRFIALVYEGEAVFSDLDSFVVLPSPSINELAVPLASINPAVTVNSTLDFTPGPTTVEMYKLLLASGTLDVNIDNGGFNDSLTVTLDIPNLKSGGVSFTQVFGVSAGQSRNFQPALNGYEFDFTTSGAGFNSIDYSITYDTPLNNGVTGTADVDISFTNLALERLTAYFGQETITLGDQEIELDIFNGTEGEGVFKLDSPLVKLDFENSIGIPVDVDLSSMRTTNTELGTVFPFTFTPASLSTLRINSSNNPNDPVALTSVLYDRSEVAEFENIVNGNKKVFNYTPSIAINADGKDTNFLNRDSQLRIKAEVELPMQGYAHGFVISDTVPFAGLDLDQGTEVTNVLFRTGVDNGFPVDIKFQLYFLDSLNNTLDSLFNDFDDRFMESGVVDADGKVTNSTLKIKEIEYDRQRALALQNATQILMKASAESFEGQDERVVKLFDYYVINVRLSMKLDLSIEP